MSRITVIGSLPPPFTGQNILTRRNADLLSRRFDVETIDMSTGAIQLNSELSIIRRVRHYIAVARSIRAATNRQDQNESQAESRMGGAKHNDAVIYHGISPQVTGHLRDVLTVVPMIPRGRPVFGVVHWGSFDSISRHRLLAPTVRRLVDRLTGFVFNDPILADRCADWIPESKRFIIANTIDDQLVPGKRAIEAKINRMAFDTRQPRQILFVANMIPSKGYMELLNSLPLLVRRGIDFQAVFAGRWQSNVDEAFFATKVSELNLSGQVTHMGQVTDRDELAKMYLKADVFALPTYYPTEAQPVSVIEALAAATPVVVSRHASLPAMVRDGREARFVDPTNPEEIAARIAELLATETWPDAAAAARERFNSKFAQDVILEKWCSLLSGRYTGDAAPRQASPGPFDATNPESHLPGSTKN